MIKIDDDDDDDCFLGDDDDDHHDDDHHDDDDDEYRVCLLADEHQTSAGPGWRLGSPGLNTDLGQVGMMIMLALMMMMMVMMTMVMTMKNYTSIPLTVR